MAWYYPKPWKITDSWGWSRMFHFLWLKHVEKMIQFRKVTHPCFENKLSRESRYAYAETASSGFMHQSVLLHSSDSLCRMAEMSTDQGPKSPHTKSHYTRKPPTCALLLLLARLTSFHSKIIGKICCVPTSTPAAHANFLCSNPWEHVVLKASQWIRQSGINDTYHHSRPGLKATMASVWHWDFRAY